MFAQFLDSIYPGSPLKIVETGCKNVLPIARWVKEHPSDFHSVDLNISTIDTAHSALEAAGLAAYCAFHCQDSVKFLNDLSWLDFCFLDSYGLERGVQEFRLAASAGAQLIVFADYSTKAAHAVKLAKQTGWEYSQVERYSVLRRPK